MALIWVVSPNAVIAAINNKPSISTIKLTKSFGNKEKELNTATKIKNKANHGILILFRCGLFEFFTKAQDKASRNGANIITRIILEITAVSATSGLILPPAA